jgi:hypothetical protein
VTFAVISHDAGASELLCAFIREHQSAAQWHIFAAIPSPMATICERNALPLIPIGDAAEQLETLRPDALLFGTGWQERVERPYVRYCKTHHIPTVAFLDHWSNYRERFGYPEAEWEMNLGDFTALSDEKAFGLAVELGLPHPVALSNYYLLHFLDAAQKRSVSPNENLLFLSEPTDAVAKRTYGDPNYWGFTQYTALEDILKNFERFGCRGLTVRLHPSETSSGYKALLKKYPHIRVQINDAKTFALTDQLLAAKLIIGFDTMALYSAALLGKAVVSYLPSVKREFLLPLPSDRQLRDLQRFTKAHCDSIRLTLGTFGMDFASFTHLLKGEQ